MDCLILKMNATGDVVRTTPLLRRLPGSVTWVTAPSNVVLLEGVSGSLRCIAWEHRTAALDRRYDLLINLEDDSAVGAFAAQVKFDRLFGAYLSEHGEVRYTDDARRWFDMSLISIHGKKRADELKFLNRQSYQELIFEGLSLDFEGDEYLLPRVGATGLVGDVAVTPTAGPVWPMKNWAHYDELITRLRADGLEVNVLPHRSSLLEHLADVRGHSVLVGGDSLPMHLALGSGVECVTIFNCTSPWEIFDYGLQTKIISPLLGEFFYRRGMDPRATAAVSVEEVFDAIVARIDRKSSRRGDRI